MSDLDSDCSAAFNNNPDISGVGVRISFYLQTFLLVILVDRSWQDAPSSLYTLIATSGGLQIAAIVQAKAGALSLLQALQVSNLVWLANFGTFVALASYSRQKAASGKERESTSKSRKKRAKVLDYHVKYAAMSQTLVSMGLTLYMWVTAKTFGPEAECSHLLKYVFFVIRVRALGSGRPAGIAISTILTAIYIVVTAHEIRSSYRKRRERMNAVHKQSPPVLPVTVQNSEDSNSTLDPPPPNVVRSANVRVAISPQPRSIASAANSNAHNSRDVDRRRPKRRRWSTDLDPMLVGIMISYAMVFTYFIVSTELLIVYNPADDDAVKEWGFGQILALIVTIPSALSVTNAIVEHGFRRLSKRKRTHVATNPRNRKEGYLSDKHPKITI